QGVRAELKGEAGAQHFAIQLFEDLRLTNRTKVFKVALFARNGDVEEAYLCDKQGPESDPAGYFVRDFLGCKRTAKPDVQTQQFFEAAERFFRGISDSEKQTKYNTALVAEMNRTADNVNPRSFANNHLEQPDRVPFLD